MTAFDYATQTWLTGEPARLLRLQQLSETRELVAGPKGAEYLRFTGSRDSVSTALAGIDSEAASLAKAGA